MGDTKVMGRSKSGRTGGFRGVGEKWVRGLSDLLWGTRRGKSLCNFQKGLCNYEMRLWNFEIRATFFLDFFSDCIME